ncbi:GNAT family N-acetyltransferase [Motilimonas sp. KMU-193]|uniref:GNAT family N-acetyltransferase n=1 Tax=Motilimonas sp. KMU-193 TaxID=3388668 RepID=UPI00396AF0CB
MRNEHLPDIEQTDIKQGTGISSNILNRLTQRRFKPDDLSFLTRLYGALREPELRHAAMSPAQKTEFVAMQFQAQQHHYTNHYSTEHFNIIELSGLPIGRLFVDFWPSEIRIVDIALMPEYRNQGIGAHLLSELLHSGKARNVPVSIHVERHNPARHLYERLGFVHKSDFDEVYLLMEWRP